MAKKKAAKKPETKSAFLRRVLGKQPDLTLDQVNRRWVKAGHPGEISSPLYYQVRSKMGIRTVWQWVREEPPASGADRATPRASGARSGGSRTAKGVENAYQLKITLRGIRPPIWRRVVVPDCTLEDLHEIVQVAMGWQGGHLHSFEVGGTSYTDPEGAAELGIERADRVKVSDIIPGEKFKFDYTYDFGDNWEHEILVEKVLPPGGAASDPVCLKGSRACPPEDVGGPWGYAEFLDAIADPANERHEDLLEWVGGEFDPEAFDLEAINEELRLMG